MLTALELLPTERLLLEGGDDRIALDPRLAANKYGCSPVPEAVTAAFGSSTASSISARGFAAADRLRHRLQRACAEQAPEAVYARELERVRRDLKQCCGVSDVAGLEIAFAASGTDLHLILGQLMAQMGLQKGATPLLIMMEALETGSSVAAALSGQHFSGHAALGHDTTAGAPLGGGRANRLAQVPIRLPDGQPRPLDAVHADIEALVAQAAKAGQPVLLVMLDLSKTGLMAPSPDFVSALRRRYPGTVDVLVDACQFRLSNATLRAYLQAGFMLAMTGSKFLTGPSFSGALFIPQAMADRLSRCSVPKGLCAYSARAEWPRHWVAHQQLDAVDNFGLLLRWQATLEELHAFRRVPEARVRRFLLDFAKAVRQHLQGQAVFRPLAAPEIDRQAFATAASWDHVPTIFPFVLCGLDGHGQRSPLTREQTQRVYKLLQADLSAEAGMDVGGLDPALAALRCQLGQPVACGLQGGTPVSALRLCASARLVVEATTGHGAQAQAVIQRALAALDKAAWLADHSMNP